MEFLDPDEMHRVCAERLGAAAGRQFAAMARPGFRLDRASADAPATGLTRLGGPALLEPGTPWPETSGVPLSLHAVLDTGALDPGFRRGLPFPPVLLNFFHLDPDVPYEVYSGLDHHAPGVCRVVAADPARAVEAAAPAPARAFPAVPLRASVVTMLPDCWDVEDGDLDFDRDEHWGAASLLMERMDGFDGNTAGRHRAFGWPDTSYTMTVSARDADGPAVHLLQLAGDAELGWGWGDAGTLYFTVPAGAFAAGDLSRAEARVQCC